MADGIAFSQSYANQLCSPTRAAILTGRIASRMGVTTATPNTKTYFNQSLKAPEGYDPHDVLAAFFAFGSVVEVHGAFVAFEAEEGEFVGVGDGFRRIVATPPAGEVERLR